MTEGGKLGAGFTIP